MFSFKTKTVKAPEKDWAIKAQEETQYTPDMAKLNQFEFQLMFVYDELRYNHPMHHLIRDGAINLATGFTLKPFILWKRKLGDETKAFALTPKGQNVLSFDRPAKVKGELYAIRPYQFPKLDTYKENGLQYQRKRVRILIPYIEEDPETGRVIKESTSMREAWMYIGCPDYWEPLLDAGLFFEPVRTFSFGKIGEVASFTQRDYKETTEHDVTQISESVTTIAGKSSIANVDNQAPKLSGVSFVRRVLRMD